MLRLRFEKTGNAVWISHLDLMRVFQRAFKRAGLPLTHTQGFNPRPSVSIALPLSVGTQSYCELLDFELEQTVSCEEISARLNPCLISGVKISEVYQDGRKLKDLRYLTCQVVLTYDRGVPDGACERIGNLFARESLIVPKKSKNGLLDQDLIPMIRSIEVRAEDKNVILTATVCCQNPSLNPTQLAGAVSLYLPDYAPDAVFCSRLQILDEALNLFR